MQTVCTDHRPVCLTKLSFTCGSNLRTALTYAHQILPNCCWWLSRSSQAGDEDQNLAQGTGTGEQNSAQKHHGSRRDIGQCRDIVGKIFSKTSGNICHPPSPIPYSHSPVVNLAQLSSAPTSLAIPSPSKLYRPCNEMGFKTSDESPSGLKYAISHIFLPPRLPQASR